VRAQLGIPQGSFVVGHAGRFCEQKNHRFLVEVAEQFLRTQPSAVFLLIGDGPLRPAIQDMVRSRGLAEHFFFAGSRADVPSLMMGAMDCFLFPSLYEGLGLVLWEAQAAGLECLVSANLPEEAEVIPARVTRLGLDEPAARWAQVLGAIAQRGGSRSRQVDRQMQTFSIQVSTGHLLGRYDYATAAGQTSPQTNEAVL
jgi:glycosyltransferase involved in cell wall biosynthesis